MSVLKAFKALAVAILLLIVLVIVALMLQLAAWLLPAAIIVGIGFVLLTDTEDKPKQ